MKPWDIYTWNFPGAGEHPAVLLGTAERVEQKPMVNVLLCSSQKANRPPKATEFILDNVDGLDWATLCKCDFVYSLPSSQLSQKRGRVTPIRRTEIALRVIRGLGLAGL
ncbi:MAG: putative Transcriptional modulator of MazE/toxin, MazF [Verrucomicrobiales bacterium]|nr:putative Transcriptional modulator of MazE/toxin, MazF [Verrucomicrobiales bacterium]